VLEFFVDVIHDGRLLFGGGDSLTATMELIWLRLSDMRYFKLIICCLFLLTVSGFSHAQKLTLMGCDWHVPSHFLGKGGNLWVSETEAKGYFYFQDEFFDEEIIEFSVQPSDLRKRVYLTEVENGYEIVFYVLYHQYNEEVISPYWIVIKNTSGKGVFYLNRFELNEVFEFAANCMPNLRYKVLQ
jgi:hypothetical protein